MPVMSCYRSTGCGDGRKPTGHRGRAAAIFAAALLQVFGPASSTGANIQPGQPEAAACGVAEFLVDAGHLAEATAAATEVLGNPKSTEQARACAASTLSQVGNRQLQQKIAAAALLRARGEMGLAAEKLHEAMTLDSRSRQLRDAYESLPSKDKIAATDVFARARALAEFGFHEEARDLLKTYLKESGESPLRVQQVPADLQYLSGGKIAWWRNFHRSFFPRVVPLLEIVTAALVLAALLYLLIRTIRAQPMLRIEEFQKGGFEEEHFGAFFSNNMLSRLHALTAGQRQGPGDFIQGPIEQLAVPQEIEAVIPSTAAPWMSPIAWARAIPALVNWIFPRRVIHITGELHASGNRGVGATIHLIEKQQILVGYTLWEEDFDDRLQPNEHDAEENLYQLAEYVAVWLLFDIRKRFSEDTFRLLGTTDWRSFAYFRAGCFADNDARVTAAHNLYVRALRRDPCLRAARVNLGLLFIRDEKYDAALEHLTQVREEAEQLPDSDRDPTLYSAIYNIAAIKGDHNQNAEAIADVRALLQLIASTFEKIDSGQKGYQDPNLKLHLDAIAPAADTMLGGLMVQHGDADGLAIIERQAGKLTLSDRHQYNLACSYTILAKQAGAAQPTDPDKVNAYFDCAVKYLRRAFQISPRSIHQARSDPTLKELREKREKQFNELLLSFNVTDEPEPDDELPSLASIATIGATHAATLAEYDIKTLEQLRERTMSAASRQALAAQLTISSRIITRWAHAADLTRITGLSADSVNLLSAIPVTTIAELAASTPQALADDLATLAAAMDIEPPPAPDLVGRWVQHANTTTLSNVT